MISNKTFVFHHLEFFENQNEFSANTTVQTITHLHIILHRKLIEILYHGLKIPFVPLPQAKSKSCNEKKDNTPIVPKI